ncbi:MAG TPA: ATP-binding cassette domain-containing protein [Candidatus Latescibacteria bacterium]|nr:ATP-binding cassette domain-containing protein [Candidatus Latescibacterota bacterium]
MGTAIEVRDVIKRFRKGKKFRKKEIVAVDRVNLSIEEGELFGLLGPNGAGKTTLIRCLCTLLIPDAGEIRIFNRDIFANPLWARRQIGVLTSGERTMYWKLSGRDNLNYFGALYGLSQKERDKRIDFLMELLSLKEFERERVERYSSGMRQKLALARTLLHDPKILLFDEPTLGLDPQFSRFIRGFIKEELSHRQGKTILLTTHYMDEADELCDRIAFMNSGKIAETNTSDGFKNTIPHKEVLELRCHGLVDADLLERMPFVEKVSVFSKDGVSKIKIITPKGEEILSDVIELLRGGNRILSVDLKEPSLEDVFIYITGRSLSDEE